LYCCLWCGKLRYNKKIYTKLDQTYLNSTSFKGKEWRASRPKGLLQHRTSPHRITGQTPALMLFQRELRTKAPTIDSPKREDTNVHERDAHAKGKAKKYMDKKHHASP